MFAIINTETNEVEGLSSHADCEIRADQKFVEIPAELHFETTDYAAFDGKKVYFNVELYLADLKAAKITEIKAQAKQQIEALSWKLERATERESCGFSALSELDDVLTERENIRQSSNKAEAAVNALTTEAEIADFTWSVENLAEHPNRITKKQFLDLFTNEEMATLLAACETNATLNVFYEKVKIATYINLNDPAVQMGLQMLELGGLLAAGRAAEILNGATSAAKA